MKKVILGLVAIAALAACSKDNGNDNSNGNGGFNNNGDPTIEQGTFPKEITFKDKNGAIEAKAVYTIVGGKISGWNWATYENGQPKSPQNTIVTYKGELPEKVESPRETETYTYEGNKLVKKVEVSDDESKETIYAYEGNNLSKATEKKLLKAYRGGQDATEYKETDFRYEGNLVIVNKKRYVELADKSKINQSVDGTTIYTVENGNVVKKEKTISPSRKRTTVYTYDNKNNPKSLNFTKITLPDYFIDEDFSKNNLLTVTETTENNGNTEVSRRFFEYDYNGDYPTSKKYFTEENGQKKPTGSAEYKY